jgi:hypothetical protein
MKNILSGIPGKQTGVNGGPSKAGVSTAPPLVATHANAPGITLAQANQVLKSKGGKAS